MKLSKYLKDIPYFKKLRLTLLLISICPIGVWLCALIALFVLNKIFEPGWLSTYPNVSRIISIPISNDFLKIIKCSFFISITIYMPFFSYCWRLLFYLLFLVYYIIKHILRLIILIFYSFPMKKDEFNKIQMNEPESLLNVKKIGEKTNSTLKDCGIETIESFLAATKSDENIVKLSITSGITKKAISYLRKNAIEYNKIYILFKIRRNILKYKVPHLLFIVLLLINIIALFSVIYPTKNTSASPNMNLHLYENYPELDWPIPWNVQIYYVLKSFNCMDADIEAYFDLSESSYSSPKRLVEKNVHISDLLPQGLLLNTFSINSELIEVNAMLEYYESKEIQKGIWVSDKKELEKKEPVELSINQTPYLTHTAGRPYLILFKKDNFKNINNKNSYKFIINIRVRWKLNAEFIQKFSSSNYNIHINCSVMEYTFEKIETAKMFGFPMAENLYDIFEKKREQYEVNLEYYWTSKLYGEFISPNNYIGNRGDHDACQGYRLIKNNSEIENYGKIYISKNFIYKTRGWVPLFYFGEIFGVLLLTIIGRFLWDHYYPKNRLKRTR